MQLSGTTERPRLAVFRSNQHLYVQVIDDTKQHTLAAASTLTKEIREAIEETAGPTIVSFVSILATYSINPKGTRSPNQASCFFNTFEKILCGLSFAQFLFIYLSKHAMVITDIEVGPI